MKCIICNKECKNYKSLGVHIRNHNVSSKDYYDKYIKEKNEEICLECGNKTRFLNLNKGYREFCSNKCKNESKEIKEKKKQTNIERYGCENPSQNKEIKEKKKQTNIERYGCENPNKNKEVKEKIKQTNIERYGFENPNKNKEVKKKIKQTNIEKYGVECSLQNKEVKEKIKQTMLKNYGVEYPLQNEKTKEKIKQTNIEKYGVECSLQNKEVKEKIKQTNIEKYGVENPSKNKEIKEKKKQTSIKNFGVDNPLKNKEIQNKMIKTKLTIRLPKVIEILKNNNIELLSEYNQNRELIKIRCKICNTIFETCYFNIQQRNNSRCPNCFPHYKSSGEIELSDFIKSIEPSEIIENSRKIIHPLELDIFVPNKNIAIEFDGLYWHSEEQGKDKYYHLNKTESCLSKKIQLIHIFEDEWIYKQDIIKSRLKQILQLNNNSIRIHARKCEIKEIDSKLKNEFLGKYHIQGKDKSNIKLGAFYNDELISVMTFSKGSIAKGSKNIEGIYELNRFCSNYNYNIPGIASKLLSYFKKNYDWKEIFSYADRRYSIGNVYFKIGFELEHITKPNYWYVKNGIRIHRFNLRKRPDEPKDIVESELRLNEGYIRIYDCGHLKFIMDNII